MANQFDIRSGQIDRQRALLDALTQRGMQTSPGQMVGNVYVGGGLLQALAGPLSAIISNYGNQSLNKQDLSNGVARQAAMNQELQGLVGGQPTGPVASPAAQIGGSQLPPVEDRSTQLANVNPEGTSSYATGSQTPINATDNASPLAQALVGQQAQPAVAATPAMPSTPPIPQNPQLGGLQNLISGGLASSFPEVQGIAQKVLAAQLSRKPETFSPQTVIGPDGNPTQILQGSYGTQKASGYNPATENRVSSGGQVYNPLTVKPGDMLPIRPQNQQNITLNPTVMQGTEEKQFSKTLGQKDAERVDTAQKTLDTQGEMNDIIQRFKQFESLPVLRGPTADWGVKAAQFGSTFGIPVPEGISNAEQFQQLAKSYVTSLVQQGGRGFTDEDAKNAMKSLVDLGNSPEGAKKMRMTLEDANSRAVKRAQQTLQIMSQRYPEVKPLTSLQREPLPSVQAPILQIKDDAGYNALPSGAIYTSPDGQTRRKQ
jgi:hypothetical protein